MRQIQLISKCVYFAILSTYSFGHDYDFDTEELIWIDNFDTLDLSKWSMLVTDYPKKDLAYYRHNLSNQYVSDGVLHIDHTFTGFDYGEEFLYSGELDLNTLDPEHPCNQPWGDKDVYCIQASGPDILPPVTATKMGTMNKFSFKYGRVEIKAKNMLGDWVRTAIWLMPEESVYGSNPRSGEIDISESSGMRDFHCGSQSRGVDWYSDTIHFGPSQEDHASFTKEHYDEEHTFADEWHVYGMIWTDTYLAFTLNGNETWRITPPEGGMWEMGDFEGNNIYENGTRMAPFDEKFYFIISTMPGAPWPFQEQCEPHRPWNPDSVDPGKQLWESREEWMPSFIQPLMIDYIKVYKDQYQRNSV